jgi:glycosyltransferase involved in cell wall biosynthesis
VKAPRTICYLQGSSEVGGSDVALLRLVERLDRAVYRPLVVLPADGPLVELLRSAGAEVSFLPMMQLRALPSPAYQGRYLARFWPTVWRLARLLRRERVELVHSNSLYVLYGAWASWLAGRPHVWHVREIPSLPGPAMFLLTTLVLALSARVILMSDAVGEALGRRHRRLRVIPDGIDIDRFRPGRDGSAIRSEQGIEPGTPLVGFVARLDPWKGAHIFVRAAAEVVSRRPQTRFLVCGGELPGHAAYARDLKGLAATLGLDGGIIFTDWRYTLGRIPEVMAGLDLLVHASVQPEPFGLVLIEAMATAKPVIASRAGGPVEIVADGRTGILVTPGDHRELAEAILSLLDDPGRARRLGQAGRRRVEERFSIDRHLESVQALYASILDARAPAA